MLLFFTQPTGGGMSFPYFDYMEFAKLAPDASVRWNLAASGITLTDPAPLRVDYGRIRLFTPAGYGAPSIKGRVAIHYGVPVDHVLPVAGTSLGIFLTAAAILEPGDHALVEQPAYQPLIQAPQAVGAVVDRLPRRFEQGFAVDPDEVARRLTPKTKLVALTNLHNPSGRRLAPEVEEALVALAEARGFMLFVDEVYRDFLPGPVGTIYRPGAPVVVTSSLTKVYGLGGLRAGWMLGPPDLLHRASRIVDLLHVNDPAPVLPFIEAAWEMAHDLRVSGQECASAGMELVRSWMASRSDLEWVEPDGGLCAFPRLKSGVSGSALLERAKRDEGLFFVPGRFFEDDRHFRLGVGNGPEIVRHGLPALGRVLDSLRAQADSGH